MKTLILILLCLGWMGNSVLAQKIPVDKVPGPARETFKSMFPDVINAFWEMDEGNFEVDFKNKVGKRSATFTAEGKWIETETEMKVSDLPAAVKQSIATEFPGYKMETVCRVDHSKHGICYEAEIEKGKESVEVLLSPNGNVLSKKVEKEEEKKEKDEKD